MPGKSSKKKGTVDIHEFPLHKMKYNSKIVIIGKPASGKSILIRNMIQVFKHLFPVAMIFCGSEENNHFYSEMFPELFIQPEYDEKYMEDFAKRQKLAMRDHSIIPKGILIVDDCSDDPKFFNRPLFQKFFKRGRHWEMMFILALQYGMDIKPVIRTNIDYIFIFREPNDRNRKAIYDNYAGIVGNYTDFCDIMDQITSDYTALVIDNRKQSNDLTDCVFYYKARIFENNIKFGCQEYRQWGIERYNTNYEPELI